MKKLNFKLIKTAMISCLVLFSQNALAEENSLPEEQRFSSIPFTGQPPQRQWRIGFRASNLLDMIEIPTSKAACEECERIAGDSWPHEKTEHLDPAQYNVLPLPFIKGGSIGSGLINPEKWFAMDLKGNNKEVSVNRLASVFSQVSSGCCYMTTEVLGQKDAIAIDSMGPTPNNLFVAFSSKPEPLPTMRRVETKQKRFISDEGKIPAEYVSALNSNSLKKALGENHQAFKNKLHQVYSQDFQAMLDQKKGVENFSITGWITEDYSCAFAIYKTNEKNTEPLTIFYKSRQAYNDNFAAKVEAAADLDGNGTDELILSVTYYEGNAFKIFTVKDGQALQLYETGYYGL